MALERSNLLIESVTGANFLIDRSSAITGGFDPPIDDYVKQLWDWRKKCEDSHKLWHGAFCERCDGAWRYPTEGGALWIARTDWKVDPERAGSDSVARGHHLLTKLVDSGAVMNLDGRRGPIPDEKIMLSKHRAEVVPALWESLSSFI